MSGLAAGLLKGDGEAVAGAAGLAKGEAVDGAAAGGAAGLAAGAVGEAAAGTAGLAKGEAVDGAAAGGAAGLAVGVVGEVAAGDDVTGGEGGGSFSATVPVMTDGPARPSAATAGGIESLGSGWMTMPSSWVTASLPGAPGMGKGSL